MEGPTPASALIHAATMVAAGTFVLARLFPIFVLSDPARLVLAVITAVTMIGAAVLAFGQSDIKRLLAYSTISQIAIMLSALAIAPVSTGAGPAVLYLLVARDVQGLAVPRGRVAQRACRRHLGGEDVGWGCAITGTEGCPSALASLPWPESRRWWGLWPRSSCLGAAHDNTSESGSTAGWIVLIAVGLTVVLTAAYCTRAWLVLTHLSAEEEVTHEAEI